MQRVLITGVFILFTRTWLSLAQENPLDENQECSSPRWGQLCPTEEKLHSILQQAGEAISHTLAQLRNKIDVMSAQKDKKAKQQRMLTDALHRFENDTVAVQSMINDLVADAGYSELIQNVTDSIIQNNEDHLQSAQRKTESLLIKRSKASFRGQNLARNNFPVPTLSGKDCAEIQRKGGRESGFYYIRPVGAIKSVKAYCDMENKEGGWTVIQRRFDGSIDFDRDWMSYKWGFGKKEGEDGEYWLGNEYIHLLTMQNVTELQIDLVAWDGTRRYALYRYFQVDNEENNYRLRKVNGYFMDQKGDVGNALERGAECSCLNSAPPDMSDSSHKSMFFTTKDRDNDRDPENCAGNSRGGWWYNHCLSANLNGKRRRSEEPAQLVGGDTDGMVWTTWRGCWESLKESRMKVRPFGFWPDNDTIVIPEEEIRRRLINSSSKIVRRLQRRRWRRHSRHRRRSAKSGK